jgi:SAM-dependent methyltransferase
MSAIEKKYWNKYYGSNLLLNIPSQFSVFVANEIAEAKVVIDIGCGNGRDTIFFSSLGICAIGVDESQAAINLCNDKIKDLKTKKINFICSDIEDSALYSKILFHLNSNKITGNILIYSRFFIHAVDENTELFLFELIIKLLDKYGGKVALEFRTDKDKNQPKETLTHYRRFINLVDFFTKLKRFQLTIDYFCEGIGFAKYKSDDAYVARFILSRIQD